MIMAWVLALIVAGSVLFHLMNPWWITPLASNWKAMDDTLTITIVITGIFFVGINLFVVYTLLRYRHRPGSPRAVHEPESKALERWLIGITTVGIMALLAPGLVVYASYVKPPQDATLLEVLGQQWQWRFRLPGADGKLGLSETRHVSPTNPFGLDPADPAGQDDILIAEQEVHLPLNKPVHVILRSHDVLHDFFVPPFRARMNMVPGQISTFWFTPTQVGRFEAMCSQLCGVGHPNMRAVVVVEDAANYQVWLKDKETFAVTQCRRPARAGRWPRAARWPMARAAWPATPSTAARAWARPGKASSARPRTCATAPPRWWTTPTSAPSSATRRRAASRASPP